MYPCNKGQINKSLFTYVVHVYMGTLQRVGLKEVDLVPVSTTSPPVNNKGLEE